MNENLLQVLESMGLKPKEASVYLALLELSRGTVSQIAKISGLKRPTIYVALEKLIKDGYITQLPEKKINQYQALNPLVILQEKKALLKNFSEILPLFQTLHNKGKSRPRIHYIENRKGIWNIYEEINYAKEAFFISSYRKIEKYFPGAVQGWIHGYKYGHYKVICRHLIPDHPEEKKLGKEFKKVNQKVRFLPGVEKYDMDFTVYDDKLAITSLEEEPFMVLIQSESLVDSIKPIFETAWQAGKPV